MYLWTLCKQFRVTVCYPKNADAKPEKAGMGTFFCNLFATPAPASQHKQTNKQCCLFNVQRVFLSFLDLNCRTPCVYSRPVCQFVHLYYMPASLSLKQNPNSPKELQLDCTILLLKLSNHQKNP